MAEFKVVIDGIRLTEAKSKAINAAIQGAVMPHLADLGGKSQLVAIPDNIRWRGIYAVPNPDLVKQLPEFEKNFGG
ncbi:MAG: hypothetical protein Q8K79_02485 [Solirubrobacteraceae bacterium]|nr:hypothetical protein [Solirubrobacteraceae bacterium]